MTIADASSFASLNKREKRKRNYSHETHDVATKTPTSSLGCSIKQPLPIAVASSFASLQKREKRKRNYSPETHDVATKTPTSSLGCNFKQPLPIADAPSFASLQKREKKKRNYSPETHDAATKTPTSSLGCSFKQPQLESPPSQSCTSCQIQDDPTSFKYSVASSSLVVGLQQQDSNESGHKYDSNKILRKNSLGTTAYPSSFASLRKREKRMRRHRYEICDVATNTQTSLRRGIELEVQHESPPSRSCTSCQTQYDPTCFKCFVVSGNLFAGLQEISTKSGCKYDYNKTFEKEGYTSFY